jgi:hypothetical protein
VNPENSLDGDWIVLSIRTIACMLNFLGLQARCISWYFSGAKVAPCVGAQAIHFSFALSRAQQVVSVGLLNVRMVVRRDVVDKNVDVV